MSSISVRNLWKEYDERVALERINIEIEPRAFVALVGRSSTWPLVAGLAGVVGLAAAIALSSRAARTTRYRPRPVTPLDIGVGLAALGAPIGLAVLHATGQRGLVWTAVAPLRFPSFSSWPALCLALLAMPVALRESR